MPDAFPIEHLQHSYFCGLKTGRVLFIFQLQPDAELVAPGRIGAGPGAAVVSILVAASPDLGATVVGVRIRGLLGV